MIEFLDSNTQELAEILFSLEAEEKVTKYRIPLGHVYVSIYHSEISKPSILTVKAVILIQQ